MGQHSPRTSGSEDIQAGVQNLPLFYRAFAFEWRKKWADYLPLFITDVRRVRTPWGGGGGRRGGGAGGVHLEILTTKISPDTL